METILIIVATSLISSAIFIPIGMVLRKKIADNRNCIFGHRQLKEHWNINPSGHYMYHQFNIPQF